MKTIFSVEKDDLVVTSARTLAVANYNDQAVIAPDWTKTLVKIGGEEPVFTLQYILGVWLFRINERGSMI